MRNTTLCHIEKDGKYLMIRRNKKQNDLNHDKYIAPGGKIEDKESPEQANRREVKEETGLTLINTHYRGIVTFVSDIWETEYMHIFTSDSFTGDITECDEVYGRRRRGTAAREHSVHRAWLVSGKRGKSDCFFSP